MIAALVRLDPKTLRQEQAAGLNEPLAPRDRLLKPRFRFPAVSIADAEYSLRASQIMAEVRYTGAGYWDSPGEYRTTVSSLAHLVLGYLTAYHATGDAFYRERSEEGTEHLLTLQRDDGSFPYFGNSVRGVSAARECLYETAIAGHAILESYILSDDRRLFNASRHAMAWQSAQCPTSASVTDNAVIVLHTLGQYKVTLEASDLKAAIDRARVGIIERQLPSGGWPGADSWMSRHGEITHALAELLSNLPHEHTFADDLKPALIAALNRAVREQMASGEVLPNPRTKRAGNLCSSILLALLQARVKLGHDLDDCIRGIMRYRLSRTLDEAYLLEYATNWKTYRSARNAAETSGTGEVIWQAEFGRFVRDIEWGEVTPETLLCSHPDQLLDSAHHQLRKSASDRTATSSQEIVSVGARLTAGFGWRIPDGRLKPGRRYRFTAWTRCAGTVGKLPIVVCSARCGNSQPDGDAFTNCEFTQEDASYDAYSPVSVTFVASGKTDCLYVWGWGEELAEDEWVSLAVDEASITDIGLPLPIWNTAFDQYAENSSTFSVAAGRYILDMGTLQGSETVAYMV